LPIGEGRPEHAVFWDSNGTMKDINPPGWTLSEATAINDSGQIVGFGWDANNLSHGFLLTPVRPIAGDLNGDGTVDCADLYIVRASFGKRTGQPGFDPRADVNHDGVVDVRDLPSTSLGTCAERVARNRNRLTVALANSHA
jgi:probable HAF family extracellular repeat protein